MPNRLSPEEIRLLEALLEHLSKTDTQKGEGLYAVEANKCGDADVYRHLYDYAKQIGMAPTPERINSLFKYLAHKGSDR